MTTPLINILTRTSNRPKYFHRMRQSLLNQTYINWRHIVHTDNECDVDYILKSGVTRKDIVVSKHATIDQSKNKTEFINGEHYLIRHRPYNLYFSKMHKLVENGWIIYIDDDDELVSDNSLELLASFIEKQSEDTFILFQALFYRRDKFYPWYELPANKKYQLGELSNLLFGELGGLCFAFHYNHHGIAEWDEYSGGDYRVYLNLNAQLNLVGLQEVIIKVQDVPNGGNAIDYVPSKWFDGPLRWARLAKHKLGF